MNSVDAPVQVASTIGSSTVGSSVVASPVVGSPYPCEVYSAATPTIATEHNLESAVEQDKQWDILKSGCKLKTETEPAPTATLSTATCTASATSPPSTLSGDEAVKRLIDECFEALATVDDSGKKIQWYEDSRHGVYCILDDEDHEEGFLGVAVERVRIRPAMDSGAVDHVIHPRELPDDAIIVPNTSGKHFRGANDSVIEKYGSCDTILEGSEGKVGCSFQLANVSRSLHSVSKVCGPAGGIKNAKQDVLFNNDLCVVVPPGIVAEILKRVTPVAKYDREGNLYVGDMTMSSFRRQEPQP